MYNVEQRQKERTNTKLIKTCKWCGLNVYQRKDGFEIFDGGDSDCKHSFRNN